jgi:hypothetical protein
MSFQRPSWPHFCMSLSQNSDFYLTYQIILLLAMIWAGGKRSISMHQMQTETVS